MEWRRKSETAIRRMGEAANGRNGDGVWALGWRAFKFEDESEPGRGRPGAPWAWRGAGARWARVVWRSLITFGYSGDAQVPHRKRLEW